MDTSVNAANQVVSVGADIAFDADPKFFACLVRFESSSVPTTLPTAYDVYPLDGRHDGGYYTVKDCVTIDVLPRTPGNNVRSEERRVGKECRFRLRWFSSRRRHTRSVSAFLLNRSSDLIAFDADPKFFACLVRFESSSVPTTLPTAYDVYPLDGRHDGGYYTVKDCVTIDVLPRTPGNNV